MSRAVTKALGNVYYQARMKAAKYNPELSIRRTAAEYLPGVEEDSLKKYELDINRPPNTVIALMADAYNAPELREWYCANECPLGRDCRDIPDMPAERALIRLEQSGKELDGVVDVIGKIMEDGMVDTGEEAKLKGARESLIEIKRRITETLAALEKAEKIKSF